MADYPILRNSDRHDWDYHFYVSGLGDFVEIDVDEHTASNFYLDVDEAAQLVAALNATMAHIDGFADKVATFAQAIKDLEEN